MTGEDNHGHEFHLGMWTRDLNNGDFPSLDLPAFLQGSSTGNAGSSRIKRSRIEDSTIMNRTWDLDSLAAYVQNELANIMARLARPEKIVDQLVLSHKVTQEPKPAVPIRSREITRSNLDRHCLSVLERFPDPSISTINKIAQDLEVIYEMLDRKSIVSQIRKWFRKRREEIGSRIVSALRRHYPLRNDAEWDELYEKIDADEINLTQIVFDARLEISDEQVAKTFAKQKILSFLKRRKAKE